MGARDGYSDSRVGFNMMVRQLEDEQRRREIGLASRETYAEKELADIGFVAVSRAGTAQVVLEKDGEQVVLECVCPSFPSIKALGWPLAS